MRHNKLLTYTVLVLLVLGTPALAVLADETFCDVVLPESGELGIAREVLPGFSLMLLVYIVVAYSSIKIHVPLQYLETHDYLRPQMRIHAPPTF